MTDGNIHYRKNNPSSIKLETISKDQHKMFRKFSEKLFGKTPKMSIRTNRGYGKGKPIILSEIHSRDAISQIFKLSETYKTKNTKPTISFLFDESNEVKWAALSIWFDYDGSISPSYKLKRKRDRKGNKIYSYYQVQFECEILLAETNPFLVEELKHLLRTLDVSSRIKRDKRNWSGLGGVVIAKFDDVTKFIKEARMISDVEVSKKSCRFAGVKKKVVMKSVQILLKKSSYSKYFKNKQKAVLYQSYLNSKMNNLIRGKAPWCSGQT